MHGGTSIYLESAAHHGPGECGSGIDSESSDLQGTAFERAVAYSMEAEG